MSGTARWNALGTYAALVVADASRLDAARAACERVLAEVDRAISRFRDDSDLARVNRAAGRWVPVAPLTGRALTSAVWAAELTDGLVDPTLGRQLVALGYDRDIKELRRTAGRVSDPAIDQTAGRAADPAVARTTPVRPAAIVPGLVGTDPARSARPARADAWREIEIDPRGAVRIPGDVALDLGATGKAFAADRIAGTVPREAGTDLVISLGGDVAVGLRPGVSPAEHAWPVSITELPPGTGAAGAEVPEVVAVHEGGLATSSVLARRWWNDGDVHHLLDPRTGRPVDAAFRTVTACGSSCVEANAISTSSIVRGRAAVAWLEHEDVAARLVGADGTVYRIAGWPDENGTDAPTGPQTSTSIIGPTEPNRSTGPRASSTKTEPVR